MMFHALICIFSGIALAALPAYGGAWLKPEGQGEAVLNALYFSGDDFFNADGKREPQPQFDKYELNLYGEYGWREDVTLGVNLFAHVVRQEGFTAANTGNGTVATLQDKTDNIGLGDPELFARLQLAKTDYSVLSLEPLIKLPSLYQRSGVPRSGSKSFDTELALRGGHSFALGGQYHYIEGRIAYRHRFHNELDGQFRAEMRAGLRLSPEWEFIPALYGIWSSGTPNAQFTEDGQNDFDLIKAEAMLRYNLAEDQYLQLGVFRHIDGRNVGGGTGLLLSSGWHF